MSPPARRVAITMEGSATQAERDFLARFVSRATPLAYQAILEERNLERIREADAGNVTSTKFRSEEDIEAEAARLCAMQHSG